MLKLFSASTCPHCDKLIDTLSKLNIQYKNIDIITDPEEARERNIRGVPLLLDEDTGNFVMGCITTQQVLDFTS